MDVFEPFSDYSHRLQAQKLNEFAGKVHLVIERVESTQGRFVFPGIDTIARIEVAGQRVGYVDYGINPLGDRLYISVIWIDPPYQRQGIGVSVLWQLWLTHRVPIVPLNQYESSTHFWSQARMQFTAAGALIEPILLAYEMEEAKQRWQHLVPEHDHRD